MAGKKALNGGQRIPDAKAGAVCARSGSPAAGASSEIATGGFIIEEPELSYVINESLDSILNEQKEWFFSNSGLRMSQL